MDEESSRNRDPLKANSGRKDQRLQLFLPVSRGSETILDAELG